MKTQKTKAARVVLGTVLASCIGGAALLGASPAMAGGADQSPATLSISKTDSETGAPLDGAVFRVTGRAMTGLYWYDAIARFDPATYTFDTAAGLPRPTLDSVVADAIQHHNDGIVGNQAMIDGFLAQVLDPAAVATHEATIAEWQTAVDEATPYNDAVSAAVAERQRLANEILAIQQSGGTPDAALVAAWQAAQDAQTAAIAVAQPYRDAVTALASGASNAQSAITASMDAQRELRKRFPGGYTLWTDTDNGVNAAGLQAGLDSWNATTGAGAIASASQMDCNAEWGVPTAPTVNADGSYSWLVAVCGGVGTLPLGVQPTSIQETVAPEGYVLDDTVYPLAYTGGYNLDFRGTEYQTDARLGFTNVAEDVPPNEPEEPPVTPPVEPPVSPTTPPPTEPPVTPPTPPVVQEKPVETLAYTGSDTSGALVAGGIAAALLAAGGTLFAFRRRTAE